MKYYPLTHVFTLNNMTYETHFTTTPTWRVIHVVTTPERHRHKNHISNENSWHFSKVYDFQFSNINNTIYI